MGDELDENITGERRKRPVPIPIFKDRYIERPYMRKEELSLIRDNLETLVDIKTGKDEHENTQKVENGQKVEKNNDIKVVTSDLGNTIVNPSPSGVIDNIKSEVTDDNKVQELKIGIGNLVNNKTENKVDNKVDSNVKINKFKNKKVIKMADEIEYTIPPEMRKQIRKSEMEEYHNEKEMQEYVRKSAMLAEQNRKELEELRKALSLANADIKNELKADLKNEFGTKINELSGKFNDITGKFENVNGKFEGVTKKLDETCTGIECLKTDLAKLSKQADLVECPECGKKVVPPLSSYCPNCNAKMYSWTEDDGVTPIKGWKPSWEQEENKSNT